MDVEGTRVIAEVKYASKGALKTLLDTAMEQIEEQGYCEGYAATHERERNWRWRFRENVLTAV